MQCALSCICLCHVLVCAGSVLASVLQFFMVLVQQAITAITFEVLFEVRRHQHISSSTNLRMILQIHLYSWYFFIIPLFSTFSLVYVFVLLFCSHLHSCPSAIALSLLFSTSSLPSSPLPSSLLPLYHSDPDGFIYHPKEARQPQSPGTATAGLVVHKQAFHMTANCVSMVSFVKPSKTCQVPLRISRIERLLDCASPLC